MQAAVQTLVEKLQPLFPEMALQSASNESLCDAIHSCGTCLKHVQLSLTVSFLQLVAPSTPTSCWICAAADSACLRTFCSTCVDQ